MRAVCLTLDGLKSEPFDFKGCLAKPIKLIRPKMVQGCCYCLDSDSGCDTDQYKCREYIGTIETSAFGEPFILFKEQGE